MNRSLINSAVSMQALQQRLDVLASNIANLNTTGYKRKEASFEDLLNNVRPQHPDFIRGERYTLPDLRQGWGARMTGLRIDLSQGPLQSTGNETDLAVEGNALFEIVRYEGGNPQTVYTRNGSFELTPDPANPDELFLTTKDGGYVVGIDNTPLKVPVNHRVAVDEAGIVTAFQDGLPPVQVGQLKVMTVIRPQYLQEIGDNYYSVPATVNTADVIRNMQAGDGVKVHQGYVEGSNVQLTEEMTELLAVQRAFQLSSRAAASADTMMSLANNLRG